MLKKVLSLLIVSVSLIAQSQSVFSDKLEKGASDKLKMRLAYPSYFGKASDKIITMASNGPKVKITEYEIGLNGLKSFTLNLKYEGKRLDLEEIVEFQDKLFLLTSYFNGTKGLRYYFIQEYKGAGQLSVPNAIGSSKWKNVSKFALRYKTYMDNLSKQRSIKLLVSSDEKSLGVLIPKSNLKEDGEIDQWSVFVFDENLEMKTGDFSSPQDGISYSDTELTNDGLILAIGVEDVTGTNGAYFVEASKANVIDYQLLGRKYYAVIFNIEKGETTTTPLEITEDRIVSYKGKFLNGSFVFCGFYAEDGQLNVTNVASGYFYTKLDLEGNIVVSKTFAFNDKMNEISDDDDDEEEDSDKKDKKSKREAKKEEKETKRKLRDLIIQDVLTDANGDIIIVAEQFDWWITEHTTSGGPNGTSTTVTTYHYEFGDILAVSCTNDGNSKWMQRIPKVQHSTNDYGFYSSYYLIQHNGELHFLMNDRVFNIEYESYKDQPLSERRKAKKRYVLGGATISASGELKRYIVVEEAGYYGNRVAPGRTLQKENRLYFFSKRRISALKTEYGLSSLDLNLK